MGKIPPGSYTRSRLNKDYAIRALRILQSDKSRGYAPHELWECVMAGADKSPNSQMEVVLALWDANLLPHAVS